MTKEEKAKIRRIIRTLMRNEGDYASAIAELCRMVGLVYPAGELGDLKVVKELSQIPEGEFKAPD